MSDVEIAAPPRVARNEDGTFVVTNIDLRLLSPMQRLGIAAQVWEQVKAMMEEAGEYKAAPNTGYRFGKGAGPTKGIGRLVDVDYAAAQAAGAAKSALAKVRPRLLSEPEMLRSVLADEHETFLDLLKAMGYDLTGRRPSVGHPSGEFVYFGKGDKFEEALNPLRRYLKGWEKREFEFTHVNPREAKRRVAMIDEVVENLTKTRADLAKRSHNATLSLPSNRKAKENSERS